jgi:hypothetical protein
MATLKVGSKSGRSALDAAVTINPPNGYTPTHFFDPGLVSFGGDVYIVDVPAGGTTTFGYTATVDAATGTNLGDYARITGSGTEQSPPNRPVNDPNAGNNEGTITMTIQ